MRFFCWKDLYWMNTAEKMFIKSDLRTLGMTRSISCSHNGANTFAGIRFEVSNNANSDHFIVQKKHSGGSGTDLIIGHGSNERLRFIESGGFTFNGDTAAANALDDYEEGSWTPNIRNDGTTATWNSQQGRYVKIGQQVTVWFNADGGSSPRSGGTSSSLIMTGLPFSQVMFGNPILGSIGANKSSGSGLYSTIGVILSAFGQGGTQVRFGAGGQAINFGIDYVAGCFTYTTS